MTPKRIKACPRGKQLVAGTCQIDTIDPVVRKAFQDTLAKFRTIPGFTSPDGWCIEFSEDMVGRLGRGAEALRRILPGRGGGHWTVVYNGVEYDPTAGWWSRKTRYRPKDAIEDIYEVNDSSPHHDWEISFDHFD